MRNKAAILLILSAMCLTACSATEENVTVIGEHTDSFSSISVQSNNESNTESSDSTNYTVNDDGSVSVDTSYLDDVETPSNDPTKTQFQAEQEVNGDNTSSDSEELYDKFGLSDQIPYVSVINRISKIADTDGFSSVEIVDTPEDYEAYPLLYIVRYDVYDYYMITYYVDEGSVSKHDSTGYLATVYGDLDDEEVEWDD